jgi:hypothetical protein
VTPKNRWPPYPEITQNDPLAEVKLEHYKAELERIKMRHQAALDRKKAGEDRVQEQQKRDYENYYAMLQAIHAGYIEVAKGTIDRSIQRADFLEKVAAAVGTVYTAALALTFAAGKDVPLPFTGILPAVFLALSFFFAAVYISFVTNHPDLEVEKSDGTLTGSVESQRNTFIKWNKAAIMPRIYWLQAATVSLGMGILLLPMPYLAIAGWVTWLLPGIGLLLVILVPFLVGWIMRRNINTSLPDGVESIPTVEAEEREQ